MLIWRCLSKLRTVRRLFDQHLPHQIADMDDFGIGYLIDNILRTALGDDDAPVAQHPEVPGDRRLRLPDDPSNITDPLRSIPQDVDDSDPCGAGHTPAKVSLDFEDRAVRHVTLPNPSRGPIGRQ
jgi:hypothetical protein